MTKTTSSTPSPPSSPSRPRVAIVGSGITGLAAACYLHQHSGNGHLIDFQLYEAGSHIGGHAHTVPLADGTPVDIGFMVFNQVTYPNLVRFFDQHKVDLQASDMSLSVSLHHGATEWSSNGVSGLFAHKSNLLSPSFASMLRDVVRFEADVLAYLKAEDGRTEAERDAAGTAASTLSDFLTLHRYSQAFIDLYLIPVCSSVWSCPPSTALAFPAHFIFSFLRNHHLLQLHNRPQWITIARRSHAYTSTVTAPFIDRVHLNTPVHSIVPLPSGQVQLTLDPSSPPLLFDHVILACHAPQSLALLGNAATPTEQSILSAFPYQSNRVVLHHDASLLPRSRACWASWNFMGAASPSSPPTLTYWLNRLQGLGEEGRPVLVTLNPPVRGGEGGGMGVDPALMVGEWEMGHPVPTVRGQRMRARMGEVQGVRGVWYAGAWMGWGFHEDGLKAGEAAAWGVLRRLEEGREKVGIMEGWKVLRTGVEGGRGGGHVGKRSEDYANGEGRVDGFTAPTPPMPSSPSSDPSSPSSPSSPASPTSLTTSPPLLPPPSFPSTYTPLPNPVSFHSRYSLFSLTTPARLITLHFLRTFIKLGHLTLREDGGSIETFGSPPSPSSSPPHTPCPLVCTLYIHSPSFYTHIAVRADLGLADAYIDGSFSSPTLLSFLAILIANRDINQGANHGKLRLTTVPLSLTSFLTTSLTTLVHHWGKRNTVSQSRVNISEHYDTGNEFFALFLDASMTYSCALYERGDETLEEGQRCKIERLIERARLRPDHRVVEIGCGWGSLSRAVAATVGCHVTGITLSHEQLSWCQLRAKEAGLDHLLTYELIDYRVFAARQPAGTVDRILSCEMLEAVGHEFLPSFFAACERLLHPRGLLVVQVITFPDSKYDEYRGNVDFIRERIFPGGLCPSLTALMEAIVKGGSGLMLEEMDNIGPHYVRTLGQWRERLRGVGEERRRELRLSEEVLRKWDYYFVYCQAGFLMRCISVLHLTYTRPSNNTSLDHGRTWL